jgi:hypothetical protein
MGSRKTLRTRRQSPSHALAAADPLDVTALRHVAKPDKESADKRGTYSGIINVLVAHHFDLAVIPRFRRAVKLGHYRSVRTLATAQSSSSRKSSRGLTSMFHLN